MNHFVLRLKFCQGVELETGGSGGLACQYQFLNPKPRLKQAEFAIETY